MQAAKAQPGACAAGQQLTAQSLDSPGTRRRVPLQQGSDGLAGLLERPAEAMGLISSAEVAMALGALLIVAGGVLLRGGVCQSGLGALFSVLLCLRRARATACQRCMEPCTKQLMIFNALLVAAAGLPDACMYTTQLTSICHRRSCVQRPGRAQGQRAPPLDGASMLDALQ
jgi:hypothetical protein